MLCRDYLILRMAEKLKDLDNFIEVVNFLVDNNIGGTINIGKSKRLDCSKLKSLIPYNFYAKIH